MRARAKLRSRYATPEKRRAARAFLGLTQREMAIALEIEPSAYWRFETEGTSQRPFPARCATIIDAMSEGFLPKQLLSSDFD